MAPSSRMARLLQGAFAKTAKPSSAAHALQVSATSGSRLNVIHWRGAIQILDLAPGRY
eukprot:CAMPEP_0204236612 /NCGR_PEP_ID=MMETSP0361-20130328/92614_1 /ASSEMBLY_ACC=CAM_ASM_000343 /TAXON_ID=268821 /ORGANISM="Scrippsiella Hangoei, Strain SHTV-5" /LENGTH=57 /DNA_ID=CAMNT_0051208703 /DNA_START=55 /DNA_END=225 /DNA_ORIENTATION=-